MVETPFSPESSPEPDSSDQTLPEQELVSEAATPEAISAPAEPQPTEPELVSEAAIPEAISAPAEPQQTEPELVSEAAIPEAISAPAEPQPSESLEGIEISIPVPALEGAATASAAEGEGGEWELLVGKLNAWFSSGDLLNQWQKIRGPLKGVAILIGVIVSLRLYASVVGTVDRIPVISGLLELTGLIGLGQFGLTKMVKTQEREQVLANWKRRWQSFRGPS